MERVFEKTEDVLSTKGYNIRIGLSLLFGLALTAISTYLFKDNIGLMFYAHPIIFSIMYLVVCVVASTYAIKSASTAGTAVGYIVINLMTGALLSTYIPYEYIRVLINAAITTGIILIIMIMAATIVPKVFEGLGKILLISLGSFIIAEILMLIFFGNSPAIMDWICIGIFTLYIGYDWSKGMEYPKTTKFALITAINLYMDIINIFIRLVSRSSSKN